AGVLFWWASISAISVLNIAVWAYAASSVRKSRNSLEPNDVAISRLHILLSLAFTLGCAFRSFLPRAEAQRICLYDSWISSASIARTVATVAELCLVAQFALVLNQAARSAGVRSAEYLSWLIVPLIALAEVFSWYTTLTTCFIGSVFEESIWATTA